MFSDDDEPPTYELGETHPLPMYSSHAGSSECLLQLEAPRMTGCPGCDWIYETKHMKINMGSRIWGLHAPSYGLGGRVEGLIKLSGEKDRIETVTATLEGRIRIVLGNRGTMSGESIVPLVSQKVTIYEHSLANLLPWDDEHHFSIEIPSESNVRGSTTLMPPSYFSYHQNVSCEVSYSIKFHLVRKGKGLKRTESKIIPILYLPKSQPTAPALPSIPRPSRHRDDASLFLHMFERVKTTKVHPFRPPECKARCLESFEDCVYLSLPSPLYFTSGQTIPFTLSLVFPDDPALAQLLTRNIRIQLLKRLTLSRKGVSEVVQRDTFVSQATLRYGSEYTEGISLLRGEIRGGDSGRERSWKIEDLAQVQYVFRIMIRPPKNFTSHVPSFRHEEILQVATDSWGTLDRELSSTGGTPTPAIGLAANLRREF